MPYCFGFMMLQLFMKENFLGLYYSSSYTTTAAATATAVASLECLVLLSPKTNPQPSFSVPNTITHVWLTENDIILCFSSPEKEVTPTTTWTSHLRRSSIRCDVESLRFRLQLNFICMFYYQ